MQGIWVRNPPLLCLFLKKVKEVFDGQGWPVIVDAEDGTEKVVQEFLQCSLKTNSNMYDDPGVRNH